MIKKLDLSDREAVQRFIYGTLVENRQLNEENAVLQSRGDIYFRDYIKEKERAEALEKRAEEAEKLLKALTEVIDTARQEGYTPETLGSAIDIILNTANGGQCNEQPL